MFRIFGFFVAAATLVMPAMASDCADVDARLRTAIDAADLDRLDALYEEAAAVCAADWRQRLGDDIAKAYVSSFFDKVGAAKGDSPVVAANLPLLDRAGRYGAPWQLLLTRAEIAFDRGHYDEAAPLYEEAVDRMNAAAMRADAEVDLLPDVDSFKSLHARMSEAALLAQSYAPPPVRRGEPAEGLFIASWRGYSIKAVPVPVQFAFGSSEFTDKGLAAATHLARYLATSGLDHVTLVGHTDPVGDEKANMTLSIARADALRSFVLAAGYKGSVDTLGKGESEPFVPDDPSRFIGDTAALHALDRRVELLR